MKRYLASLIILLFAGSAWANDNPRLISYPQGKIMGFRGLDTKSSVPTTEDGRAIDLYNVKLSSAFDLRKRYGYSVVNGTLDDRDFDSSAITGIFDAEFSSGASWTLAFIDRKLKYDNSGTWTQVSGSGTFTANDNAQYECVMALDKAICTDNDDPVVEVSSAPASSNLDFSSLSSPVTKANALLWFNNYLIVGNTTEGGTTYPTRFRWSNVGTTETWDDADFNDIASLSGDEIVALKELFGDIYIFMRKSIWKASLVGGNDVFTFSKVTDKIGAIAKGSVQVVTLKQNRLGIIFLSEEKRIFLTDGTGFEDIGYIIQPSLDELSPSRLQYATSTFDGKSYYLAASTSGVAQNDIVYELQLEIFEWTRHSQVDVNAFGRIKESTSVIKTYFGNYEGFVYWLDNPDNLNDVDGATGIADSAGTINTPTMTGAQMIIDAGMTSGTYTGATLRITSGTGAGQEAVIMTHTNTGFVISTAFSTTPDSTSNYSIGDINAYYYSKWYDMGDITREKTFRKLLFWGESASSHAVTIDFARDFGSQAGSTSKSLAPSTNSLWDSAIWDQSVWGGASSSLYTTALNGYGRVVQIQYSQPSIDSTFHLYGYNILGDRQDIE